jgi:tRNA 2-thiouridine synthesizing protein A
LYKLDARNLLCPMPVIKTQNKMKDLSPGDELEVICTDPGTLHDVPAWCRVHGHEIVSTHESDDLITIVVRCVG